MGCPHQLWFGRIRDFDALVVVSNKNMLGRLDPDTGKIGSLYFNSKDLDRDLVSGFSNKQRKNWQHEVATKKTS